MDLNPEWQDVLPPEPVKNEVELSVPLEELLDEEAFTGLGDYDQSEPGNLEEEIIKYNNEELLLPLLLASNAERQRHDGKISRS